jgi:hypothetical protein
MNNEMTKMTVKYKNDGRMLKMTIKMNKMMEECLK